MRVLHIVTKLGLGGAERMAETLAAASAAQGFEVSLLALGRNRGRDEVSEVMRSRLLLAGVRVVDASKATSKKSAAARSIPAIGRELTSWKPDVVHVHTEVPQLALALTHLLWPRARRHSTVLTVHSSVNWPKWELTGRLTQRVLHDAHLVAVSESALDSYLDLTDRECSLVLNGVAVQELGRRPRRVRRTPRYLFAARLEPEKGVDTLLEALERLESSEVRFEMTITGSGSLEGEVRTRTAELQRPVRLNPPSSSLRSDLVRYDALVMPSRHEGMSLLAEEALCVGLPILATSAPGLVDTLPFDYPGCVPPGDARALADLLETFASNPNPWLDRMASDRRWARHRYDSRTMVEGYARVYEAAVADGRPVAPTRS